MDFNLVMLVGLTPQEADEILKPYGYHTRVIQIGDEPGWITMDLRQDRLNVFVSNNNIITRIGGIY